MPEINFKPLVLKNLLTAVNAAVGTTMFQHTYVLDLRTGQEIDTLKRGDVSLACAAFVSSLLAQVWLIDRSHSTVATTLAKMAEAGWYKIDAPKPGAVVHWPAGPLGHEHIGFVVDDQACVSTSSSDGVPVKTDKIHDGREPDAFYWHPKLDDQHA